jgi:hypothetical protein
MHVGGTPRKDAWLSREWTDNRIAEIQMILRKLFFMSGSSKVSGESFFDSAVSPTKY